MVKIIYHANCVDGFTAAWAMYLAFGSEAEYIPASYNDPTPPPVDKSDDVYIVDFSYSREVVYALKEKAKSLLILDHHKSAQEALSGLDYAVFDMNRSGAGIAWDHMHSRKRPWLINYVEDHDLFRFKLPHSRAVRAYIRSIPHTFSDWFQLHGTALDQVINEGSAILRYIEQYVISTNTQAVKIKLGDHHVYGINSASPQVSDLLHDLLKRDQKRPFSVAWNRGPDGLVKYSLRSRDSFDVAALAVSFGGGGHKKAAGFHAENEVHTLACC
jgi:nanoRNase/pAp phosphatase (c-di-AMP/oligoRNAs hydrolase)